MTPTEKIETVYTMPNKKCGIWLEGSKWPYFFAAFVFTVLFFSVGVKLEGKNQFLTPTEKIETVYTKPAKKRDILLEGS